MKCDLCESDKLLHGWTLVTYICQECMYVGRGRSLTVETAQWIREERKRLSGVGNRGV